MPTSERGDRLVFEDTFDGSAGSPPDPSKWDYEIGYIRNNEKQFYTNRPDNCFISKHKTLTIVANNIPEQVDGGRHTAAVTSASIFTKQAFKYGRFEVRLKVPSGRGVWPACWLLGEDLETTGWPKCGEIDMMEYVGFEPGVAHCALHSAAHNHLKNNQMHETRRLSGMEKEFHDYVCVWTPNHISLCVDKHEVLALDRKKSDSSAEWPFDHPFRLKLNLAIGGDWGGQQGIDDKLFPAVFEIEHVRVFELADAEDGDHHHKSHGIREKLSDLVHRHV